jgi:hypothetical protein
MEVISANIKTTNNLKMAAEPHLKSNIQIMDFINALPGNSSVDTNRRENVFYAVRAEQKHGNTAVKYIHNNGRRCFPWGPCKKKLS